MNPIPTDTGSQTTIFDRSLVRRRRDRAAKSFPRHNALLLETAGLLSERVDDVRRDFSSILDLGAHDGALAHRLRLTRPRALVVAADLSAAMLNPYDGVKLVADEEYLPFAADSFDLIVSNLSLHWVNDLPGALLQIKRALRTGGLFLAALAGGETLHELRASLMEAELALTSGVSPRLSPTVSMTSASALLQRAGFDLPVVDHEICTLAYKNLAALMADLRGMGESNAHTERLRHASRQDLFTAAAAIYETRFRLGSRLPATFDIVFLHGWKPDIVPEPNKPA